MNEHDNVPTTTEKQTESLTRAERVNPLVDIYENQDEYLFIADMPGVEQSSLAVNYDRGVLTLEGLRLLDASRALNYWRSFRVPRGIDTEKISAELQAGVLQVHLPKASSAKPRTIPITVG